MVVLVALLGFVREPLTEQPTRLIDIDAHLSGQPGTLEKRLHLQVFSDVFALDARRQVTQVLRAEGLFQISQRAFQVAQGLPKGSRSFGELLDLRAEVLNGGNRLPQTLLEQIPEPLCRPDGLLPVRYILRA